MNFVLFRIANSFKYIGKYGILHYKNTSIVQKLWNNYTYYNEIFNIQHIYNLTKNTSDINICVFELLKYEINIMLGKKNKQFKKLVNRIILYLIEEKYITINNRKKLIKFRKEFNEN